MKKFIVERKNDVCNAMPLTLEDKTWYLIFSCIDLRAGWGMSCQDLRVKLISTDENSAYEESKKIWNKVRYEKIYVNERWTENKSEEYLGSHPFNPRLIYISLL